MSVTGCCRTVSRQTCQPEEERRRPPSCPVQPGQVSSSQWGAWCGICALARTNIALAWGLLCTWQLSLSTWQVSLIHESMWVCSVCCGISKGSVHNSKLNFCNTQSTLIIPYVGIYICDWHLTCETYRGRLTPKNSSQFWCMSDSTLMNVLLTKAKLL